MSDAGTIMAEIVSRLAEDRPDLRDSSGRAFWPVPASFPLILSKCLFGLQELATGECLAGCSHRAQLVSAVRIEFLRLTADGDLGEDHTSLFLKDHPKAAEVTDRPPFGYFCEEILKIEDPIVLLGAISRNEEGSISEIAALVESRLIDDGAFARKHLEQEHEHARRAETIAHLIGDSGWLLPRFQSGLALHDRLYSSVAPVG